MYVAYLLTYFSEYKLLFWELYFIDGYLRWRQSNWCKPHKYMCHKQFDVLPFNNIMSNVQD